MMQKIMSFGFFFLLSENAPYGIPAK